MKKETILKVILILIIGSVLLVKPINVFATSTGEPADIDDFWDNSAWEHQGSAGDLKEEEEEQQQGTQQPSTQQPSTQQPSTQQPSTQQPSTQQSTKQELPKAGLAEDTIMVVSLVALIGIAAIAFKKINEYNNI